MPATHISTLQFDPVPQMQHEGLPAAGERVDAYRISGEIGRGSLGVVYRAMDTRRRRWVALKLPRPGARDAALELRCEARRTGLFHHRNIVRSHGGGNHNGLPYMALELLDGEDLAHRIDSAGAMPMRSLLTVAAGIARGLAAMHRRGIVHRDLKPGNVRVTSSGSAKIFDLGVPAAMRRRLPGGGFEYSGIPEYSAPEQCLCEEARIGPATDLYALGVLIFEMASGRAPFASARTSQVLYDQVVTRPIPISELRPAVPPELMTLVVALLAKDSRDRPQRAATVAAVLERLAKVA